MPREGSEIDWVASNYARQFRRGGHMNALALSLHTECFSRAPSLGTSSITASVKYLFPATVTWLSTNVAELFCTATTIPGETRVVESSEPDRVGDLYRRSGGSCSWDQEKQTVAGAQY
jgi:hypothetical protein